MSKQRKVKKPPKKEKAYQEPKEGLKEVVSSQKDPQKEMEFEEEEFEPAQLQEVDNDEGFESCEEDEQMLEEEKYMFYCGHQIESDVYFEWKMHQQKDHEAKKYMRLGREAFIEVIPWLDLTKGWTYSRSINNCDLYSRDAQ
mmetsp:Transcript_21403/g.20580  ORF Transcript_21403/g.20580 Transcript_21403/m.20580 type:complete len:142 (+) Transcript_21403:306-731(+)